MSKNKAIYIFFATILIIGLINLIKLNRNIDNFKDMPSQIVTPLLTPPQTSPPSDTTSQTPVNSDYQLVLKKISQLEFDIASLKNQNQTNNQPTATTQSDTLNMLEIADPSWQKIDVFDKPLASSKIIGQADYGIIYFYSSKQSGWYQISLDIATSGWVQSQFIKELP
jgi:SH3 domain-containing protein